MPRGLPKIASLASACALAMTITATSSSAYAAPSEAQERFEEGRALLKAGRAADAIPKFVASIAAEPTIAALLNLADCYERIGKLASAHARFRQAQELARSKDAVRSEEARKRAEILEPRLSTITLLPPAQTDGARVWVDGVEVPSAEWGKPRPYDPGAHEIVSQDRRGARRTSTAEVPSTDGARITSPILTAETNDAKVAPPAVAPIGPAPPPERSEASPVRTVGIVTGGVGLAVLATGIVTGVIALGAKSDLTDACAAYPRCPADKRGELVDLDDRARTFGTVSTITVIAGSALIVAGVVLYLVAPPRASSGSTSAAWARGWTAGTW